MFAFDKRFIYIILGMFVLMGLIQFISNPDELLGLLLTLPGVLIAIVFHEFAHAFAADRLGDDTPRMQGRLNLNPASHLDPVGTILLIFAHFGWGKPVQINPRNFDRKVTMQTGEVLVSLAGPLMNFFLSIIFAFILAAMSFFNVALNQVTLIIFTILQYALIVNIGLGVFNLLPLPPLDGSKIFMNIMPYKIRYWMIEHEQIFYFIFLGLWITGLASMIISPIINVVYEGIVWCATAIFSLF